MILVDANVLIYAYSPTSREHGMARAWLAEALSRPEPVRLAWTSVLAFMRILTSTRIFRRPLSIQEAIRIVDSWFEQPAVDWLQPGSRHWAILSELLSKGQARGPLVMDAHLAALAIEHGATLCTTDKDFLRFPGLKISNPVEPAR